MEFQEIVTNRRAINFFDPGREVEESLLRRIMETAANAPSSFNLQPWKVVIFRDPEKKAALQKLAFDQPKVSEAPVVLMLLADRQGWTEGAPTLESVFTNSMKPEQRDWFINACKSLYGASPEAEQAFANKNAALYAMSLMYAASDLGLHTHPMDGFFHDKVREEFEIPEQYWIPMLIALGYAKPDLEMHPKGWRQSYEEMVLKTL